MVDCRCWFQRSIQFIMPSRCIVCGKPLKGGTSLACFPEKTPNGSGDGFIGLDHKSVHDNTSHPRMHLLFHLRRYSKEGVLVYL